MATAETIYYQQDNVLISNSRAVLQGTTYPVANITSVGLGTISPSLAPVLVLLVIGLCGFAYTMSTDGARVAGTIWGVIFAGLAVLIFLNNKERYFVKIASASGEQRALESRDKADIQKIVDALNEAIIKRG